MRKIAPYLQLGFPQLGANFSRQWQGFVGWRRTQKSKCDLWSLNPGRYVGVAERAAEDFDFAERLEELNEELEVLNAEARELEGRIAENVAQLLNL